MMKKQAIKVIFVASLASFLLTLLWWLSLAPRTKSITQQTFQINNSVLRKPPPAIKPVRCQTERDPSKQAFSAQFLSITNATSFQETLRVVSNGRKDVILSLVDYGVREFALNLYISSIAKFNFNNHLFVCTDKQSVAYLSTCDIPCYYMAVPAEMHLSEISNTKELQERQNSDFGSDNYHLKTNFKTRLVLDALIYGYNVLMCDLDVVLFKDPFPYFTCDDCDLHISRDRELWNSGFIYARSTSNAIKMYQLAWDYYRKYHKSHDQSYINMAVRDTKDLKVFELSRVHFPCGHYYFRADFRMFNNTPKCSNCVMVHNNYIGSTAAKKYRFKENLLWYVDNVIDAYGSHYYSNNKRVKYLTYNNPHHYGPRTHQVEVQALKNALVLGLVTGRVVILPTFHCCDCLTGKCDHPKHRCSLLSVLKLNTFDKEYQNKYREHVFLHNNMVTRAVKRSPRQRLHLNVTTENHNISITMTTQVLNGKNNTVSSIKDWLNEYKSVGILEFEALYGDFRFLLESIDRFYYNQHESTSFQCSDYDQWEVKDLWPGIKQNQNISAHSVKDDNINKLNSQGLTSEQKTNNNIAPNGIIGNVGKSINYFPDEAKLRRDYAQKKATRKKLNSLFNSTNHKKTDRDLALGDPNYRERILNKMEKSNII